MKYIKLYENKKSDYIVLLPSGEVLEVDENSVNKIFYDNDTYGFDDFEIEWDYDMNMYKSEDKYKKEIIKRNEMFINGRMKEYKNKYPEIKKLINNKLKNESFDWDDEDFDEEEFIPKQRIKWRRPYVRMVLPLGTIVMLKPDNELNIKSEGTDNEGNRKMGTIVSYNKNSNKIGWPYEVRWDGNKHSDIYNNSNLLYTNTNESIDWDDEDFDEDEMDNILGVDMYYITVKSDKLRYGWSNCLNIQKGIIKFITRHITYPKYLKDRYKIPMKNETIHRYAWIPNKENIKKQREFSEKYMKEILNNFDNNNMDKMDICFSTKDNLYDNLKTAINITSKRLEFFGERKSEKMKNIDIDELIENIDNDNLKDFIHKNLRGK